MSKDSTELLVGLLKDVSVGGITADHAASVTAPTAIAPSSGSEFNQLRSPLIPKGCWRLEDVRFGFDSSFLLPGTKAEIKLLAKLIDDHTEKDGQNRKPPLTVFGHADPVNNDEYNKFLSGRRALTVLALLTRRTEVWEDLFSNTGKFTQPVAGDRWGTKAIQTMLDALGFPPGAIDGVLNENTREAVRQFQGSPQGAGLSIDGQPGAKTREKLFLAYMDFLCGKDSKGAPFLIDPKQGLLAQSQRPDGKGDVQGCGEFNPILLFSKQEKARLDRPENKSERDQRNKPNRRVTILLFRPGTLVDPKRWPCPTVKEGSIACKARFFSDGETRRSNQAVEREFEKTRDTFACRFYQQLTTNSPCERKVELVPLRIRLIDVSHQPVKNAKYTLEIANLRFEDSTDDQGGLEQMIPAVATTGTLKLEAWTVTLEITNQLGEADEPRGARLRFENLGLAAVEGDTVRANEGAEKEDAGIDELLRRAILRFQSMVDLEPDGTLNEETVSELRKVYGS